MSSTIRYIDEVEIRDKRVLLRVDFNVALADHSHIADDFRIQRTIPTIKFLLGKNNRLILVSHLGKPKERSKDYSLDIVRRRLQSLIPECEIILVDDFRSEEGKQTIRSQTEKQIVLLENIRFYPEEKENDENFARELALLGDVYVNDAFGVSHRENASTVGVPKFIPSYGGLLLKKEVDIISQLIREPKKPYVAIIGGAKISTKIHLLDRLLGLADYLIVGGGIANTILASMGYQVGKSLDEKKEHNHGKKLIELSRQKNTKLIYPDDVVSAKSEKENKGIVKKIAEIELDDYMLDIGPETEAKYGFIIAGANTIVWNGPVGYIENPAFRHGTDFIYYSITQNARAVSVIGGGETLSAVSKKEHLEKITHVSTGGGAMLEFIERGTLPGLKALSYNLNNPVNRLG